MKELILSNEFTHRYFVSFDENVEIISQVPIYFDYMDLECKGLLDGILINHREKTIQPYDLKSTGKSVYEFEKWLPIYGYHRQAAFYSIGLREWISEKAAKARAIGTPNLGDYEVLPFKFIVVESKLSSKTPAIIYEMSDDDMLAGLEGGIPKGHKRHIKGINELIEDYKWHKENDKWLLRREFYEADGVKQTNIF